jgi:hypothetical protein
MRRTQTAEALGVGSATRSGQAILPVATIDRDALVTTLRRATERISELLLGGVCPDAPVPGLAWDVGEVVAHLVADIDANTDVVLGRRDLAADLAVVSAEMTNAERIGAINARMKVTVRERDPRALADRLTRATESFLEAMAPLPGDRIVRAWDGEEAVTSIACAMLSERLIHGRDLARSARCRWHRHADDARLAISGVAGYLVRLVDPARAAGRSFALEFRIRQGPRFVLRVRDGKPTVEGAGASADCWISADPETFLLVGFGRRSKWRAAFSGAMIAGGRRPWMARSADVLTPI